MSDYDGRQGRSSFGSIIDRPALTGHQTLATELQSIAHVDPATDAAIIDPARASAAGDEITIDIVDINAA